MMIKHIREPFNAISHFFAAVAAFGGTIYLILKTGWIKRSGLHLVLYGISVVLLFSSSAIYHSSNGDDQKLMQVKKV